MLERTDPDNALFVGLRLELENIIIGINVLNAKVRDLNGCFEHAQQVSAKLTAEDISKTAGEVSILAGCIANRISEFVARKPRIAS